jgi:type I restriction enzyme S subunit
VFVDTEIPEKLMVKTGDILICVRNGSRDLIGKCAQIDKRAKGMTFGAFMTVFRSPFNNFVSHQFQSGIIKKQINEHLGATINQITNKSLNSFLAPLPPTLAEQEAIAEALSDADAYIEALEQLLTKKRQVKQGAMQKLLTGKKRLPEFSKKWETKKLGDVFEITAGGDFDPSQSSDIRDERFPYPIYSNAITDHGLYGFCSYANHEAGSITVTARGTLGAANYRDHDFTAIGRVIVLKPIQPLDGRFISEYINNRINFVIESTGVPQLTAPQISKYEILFPEFPEQTAIAEILSEMDEELSALAGKLVKARQVKAGMMSELLTGKIRLV